ncbi:glucoamylase family protein, partial [Candidatus Omnitrophota bacterium]
WKQHRQGEGRFLKSYWTDYNEAMILYIMAIGSPSHPIQADSWLKIHRPVKRYGEHVCIAYAPLFVHQYSHIWIDFRDKNDGIADYFQNSVIATRANREFCIDQQEEFKTYEEDIWGITASDGPDGYRAYGGKPGHEHHDGTVAPTAAGGSIVFTPELSKRALRAMYDKYKDRLWGRYGFSDSFNIDRDWFATDCIGIDQGTLLLMIENEKSELLWNYFMRNTWIQKGMERIGFAEGTKFVSIPPPPSLIAHKKTHDIVIDGTLAEWVLPSSFNINDMYVEYGSIDNEEDLSGVVYLQYDADRLYIGLDVRDDAIIGGKGGTHIYKDDCLEIFTDFQENGFVWGNPKDVQIGLLPNSRSEDGSVKSWAWFQNRDPIEQGDIVGQWNKTENGYTLETAISFDALMIQPTDRVRFSISLHDKDAANSSEVKVTTYFEELNGKDGSRELGYLIFK